MANEPRQEAVPRAQIARRQQLPTKLIERPVRFRTVSKHGRRHPIGLHIQTPASDRHDVIDGRRELPEREMRYRHLPVRVIWKLCRQPHREYAEHTRKHQVSAGVAIDEAVPKKYFQRLIVTVLTFDCFRRGEGILPPQKVSRSRQIVIVEE